MRTAEEERADVLAYLARKAANARTIAARSVEQREAAERDIRCIQVIAGDLLTRMHEGEAEMARADGRPLTPFEEKGEE